jgi:hypothetical protein
MALCSFVEVDRRFRGAYCLLHPDDRGSMRLYGAIFQKAVIILAAVRN